MQKIGIFCPTRRERKAGPCDLIETITGFKRNQTPFVKIHKKKFVINSITHIPYDRYVLI